MKTKTTLFTDALVEIVNEGIVKHVVLEGRKEGIVVFVVVNCLTGKGVSTFLSREMAETKAAMLSRKAV